MGKIGTSDNFYIGELCTTERTAQRSVFKELKKCGQDRGFTLQEKKAWTWQLNKEFNPQTSRIETFPYSSVILFRGWITHINTTYLKYLLVTESIYLPGLVSLQNELWFFCAQHIHKIYYLVVYVGLKIECLLSSQINNSQISMG